MKNSLSCLCMLLFLKVSLYKKCPCFPLGEDLLQTDVISFSLSFLTVSNTNSVCQLSSRFAPRMSESSHLWYVRLKIDFPSTWFEEICYEGGCPLNFYGLLFKCCCKRNFFFFSFSILMIHSSNTLLWKDTQSLLKENKLSQKKLLSAVMVSFNFNKGLRFSRGS